MNRKVYIDLTVRLVLDVAEGLEIEEVINEMDYDFRSNIEYADIVDTQIKDYNIVDSK